MLHTKRFFLALLGALFLSSCDPIEGKIGVLKQFRAVIVDQNCIPGRDPCQPEKKVVIPSGEHDAKVSFVSKKLAVVSIKVKKTTHRLNFSIPSGLEIPTNGEFKISSKDSGQLADLEAGIQTLVDNSEIYGGEEACKWETQERVCRVVPLPNGGWGEECYWRTVEHWGRQDVEYFFRTTTQKMKSNLIDPSTAEKLAEFGGDRADTEKIYTYKGQCRFY